MTKTPTDQLSDTYVADLAQTSPMLAIQLGLPIGRDGLDDLSPDGIAERFAVARDAKSHADRITAADADEALALDILRQSLTDVLDFHDSGWLLADLNVIASPPQELRMIFDVLPADTAEQQAELAGRMAGVAGSLAGYRQSLSLAAERGQVAARKQVETVAQQCRTWAGSAEKRGFFTDLVAGIGADGGLGADLQRAAQQADAAYGELADYLSGTLLAAAPEQDAVGRERYALGSRLFLGAVVDMEETYAWGWQEFLRLEAEMADVAERIAPGAGPTGAAKVLDDDPAHQVRGVDGLQAWMQELSDRAVEQLGRTHFDIPEPIRKLDCKIAPPGGGVGAYYLNPTDDFSRPGSMWWSVEDGQEVFGTWRETTTVYHEGVPGHHLQIATAVYRRDVLNDFRRSLALTSGHAEGWALYAERLVRELGYLDDDGNLLGLLDSQVFRAARVVLDIGMHLQLPIPAGTGFHEGEIWTPELGLEFLLTRTLTPAPFARDEIKRYLGWPGQAPSYKIGERIWLEGRQRAQQRHGDAFDLKAFHTAALAGGGMGLDPLARFLDTL